MTSPDQIRRIKDVLTDVEKVCGNCRCNGVSDCNRPGGLCEMFDAVWNMLDYINELEGRFSYMAEAVMKEGEQ